MKTLKGIYFVLVLFLLSACSQKGVITGVDLISIHDITLKPGADEKEFEKLVINEIAPLYKQVNGQDLFLSKGYVGQRTGQYAIFITFPTVEDRNGTYHLSGEWSKEFLKFLKEKKLCGKSLILWQQDLMEPTILIISE